MWRLRDEPQESARLVPIVVDSSEPTELRRDAVIGMRASQPALEVREREAVLGVALSPDEPADLRLAVLEMLTTNGHLRFGDEVWLRLLRTDPSMELRRLVADGLRDRHYREGGEDIRAAVREFDEENARAKP
jgi:hypothetical protein